ncbi:MAG: EamA family transporter [Rhodospirillaceae bacterium]|jgi:drug/metabolite transporter (DMT)-like permease|nr:EamA family transporter [Rhodospirillaceae bacterium]MBT6511791.1 EamA family transporter [Rhodospirillaceae bacterium]MBT7646174.1 EamA family transporter [Rhodospirillaceae bacterium]
MGLSTLPLAEAATLFYSSPLMITALSVPFLRETVGARRWLAVFAGFAGVIVVMRPTAGGFDPAMLYSVGAALTYALSMLINRASGQQVTSISFAIHSTVITFVATSVAALVVGDGRFLGDNEGAIAFLLRPGLMPLGWDLVLLAVIGPISAIGFILISEAYRVAPVSLVSPFEYSSLPVAVLFGFVFFGDLPQLNTWAGLALIVGAGLYILHRERVNNRMVNRGWPPIRPKL